MQGLDWVGMYGLCLPLLDCLGMLFDARFVMWLIDFDTSDIK